MPVLSCLRPAADAPVAMEDEDEYPTARRARAFSRLVDAPAHDTSDFAILPYDVICHVLRFALAERGGYARLCALSRASYQLVTSFSAEIPNHVSLAYPVTTFASDPALAGLVWPRDGSECTRLANAFYVEGSALENLRVLSYASVRVCLRVRASRPTHTLLGAATRWSLEPSRPSAEDLDRLPSEPEVHECCGRAPIGDAGMARVARVLPALPKLNQLVLAGNDLGDAAATSLAAAVARCGLPALELLVLHRNRIGDHGAMELVGAAAGGAAAAGGRRRLPSLTELHLSANRLGADAAVALASALDGGAFPALARLYVGGNQMPTRALDVLVQAAARRGVDLPHLWRL